MKVDYITLSIPLFFILIGLELLYGYKKKLRLYRLNDSLTNISLGVGQQVTGVFMKTALFYGYLYLYENLRFATMETTLTVWVCLFLGVDFFYYWFHRMSHEINALWAAHIVHHQSEEYNLSVALRQSWFQNAFSWVFYLPLALAGFEPIMFLSISSFNTLYQFWIHTRIIGKMGPLEWVLNTPSHHRVHHGSDPKYLDKNHGGTLIIWDRLFGTFREEEEAPHYGITKPLQSWNPLWANFHYWVELLKACGKVSKFSEKILLFLKPPGWMPLSLGGAVVPAEIDESRYSKYDLRVFGDLRIYILIQFTEVIFVTTLMLFMQAQFSMLQLIVSSGWILLSITSFGAVFENKSWSRTIEYARLISQTLIALLFVNNPVFHTIIYAGVAWATISVLWFYSVSNRQISFHKN